MKVCAQNFVLTLAVLLLAASVQGHEFDSATLSEAAEMDAADVEERLDELERVHVFVRRGRETEFPDRTLTLNYQFVHVLYQNMLHASLQPTRLHRAFHRSSPIQIARQHALLGGDRSVIWSSVVRTGALQRQRMRWQLRTDERVTQCSSRGIHRTVVRARLQ